MSTKVLGRTLIWLGIIAGLTLISLGILFALSLIFWPETY